MKRSTYDIAQSINFDIYTFFGYWKINSENKCFQLWYNIYSRFVIFMTTIYTLLQIIDLKDTWGSVEDLSSNLSATLTSIFSLSKVYLLKYQIKRVEKLRKEFRNFLNVPGVGTCPRDMEILEEDAARYMKMSELFYVMVWFTILAWWVGPVFYGILPVRLWTPFGSVLHGTYYAATYLYECLLLGYFAAIVMSIDLILCCFIFLISAHFKILEKNINSFGAEAEQITLSDAENKKRVELIVRHHQQILRVIGEVDAIFRLSTLIHFIGVGVLISVTEFDVIQKTSVINFTLVRPMGNLVTAFVDLFIYSFFGSVLQQKSFEIALAVYNCPWLALSPRSRRMLMFIMIRAQKKATLTAGKLLDVNLETYLSILRTSYNLLAVLRQTK